MSSKKIQITEQNLYEYIPEYKLLYRKDPERWFKERWSPDNPDAWNNFEWSKYGGPYSSSHKWDGTKDPMATAWRSIAKHKWVGIESGTSMGKSYWGSLMVLWYLDVHPSGTKVAVFGASFNQLKDTLGKEVQAKFYRFKQLNPHAIWNDKPQVRLPDPVTGQESIIIFRGSSVKAGEESSVATQGLHAEYMCILVDEAAGANPAVVTALKNTCTGDYNVMIMMGNPDNTLDQLHKFSTLPDPNIVPIRVSAYDFPNVVLKKTVVPGGAVGIKSIETRRAEYGEDSPFFKSRVRGISPDNSVGGLITMDEIHDARFIKDMESFEDPLNCLAMDVAESSKGDKACVSFSNDRRILYVKQFQCPRSAAASLNIMYDGDELYDELENFRDSESLDFELPFKLEYIEEPYGYTLVTYTDEYGNKYPIDDENIGVDAVGLTAGISTFHLKGVQASPIKASERPITALIPTTEEGILLYDFNNIRTQMYFLLIDAIKNKKISLDFDEDTFLQFVTEACAVKLDDKNNKTALEHKLKTRERLGHSPNILDAVMYNYLLIALGIEGIPFGNRTYGYQV